MVELSVIHREWTFHFTPEPGETEPMKKTHASSVTYQPHSGMIKVTAGMAGTAMLSKVILTGQRINKNGLGEMVSEDFYASYEFPAWVLAYTDLAVSMAQNELDK